MQLLDVVVEPNPGPNHKQLGKQDVDHPPDSDHNAAPAARGRTPPRSTPAPASPERKRHSHEQDERTRPQGRRDEQGDLDDRRARRTGERLTTGRAAPAPDNGARRFEAGNRASRVTTTTLVAAWRPSTRRARARGSARGRSGKIPRPAIISSAASHHRPALAVLEPPGNTKHRHRDSPYESSVSTARHRSPITGNRTPSPLGRPTRPQHIRARSNTSSIELLYERSSTKSVRAREVHRDRHRRARSPPATARAGGLGRPRAPRPHLTAPSTRTWSRRPRNRPIDRVFEARTRRIHSN
ncbi:hypothetical protein J2S53_001843 [Actinopolyspora lacussalsi]|nr:hypothetical protein [Actinopolyspora lacussalsi]